MGMEFELLIKGETVKISEHYVGENQIFRVVYDNSKLPLIITKTNSYQPGKFWTSLPEGRQSEAEEIGVLITEYFRRK